MREMDRDIKSYLQFDTKSMAMQMNNAFEGKKPSISSQKTKADHSITAVKQSADEKGLEPILEESTGQELALYKPNMSL